MFNKKKRNNNKGFTLVELLVVIAIIGILAVVAVPTLFKQIDKSRVADVTANVNSIKTATMSYYSDKGTRPTLAATPVTATDLVSQGYLDTIPDKNGMTYVVNNPTGEVANTGCTVLTVTGIKSGMVEGLESTYGASAVNEDGTTLTIVILPANVQ